MTRRYAPTEQDVKRWRRLTRLALDAAAVVRGPGGDLLNAARKAERAVAPDSDSQRETFSPLIRLAAAWPAMPDAARSLNAERLAFLARAAEQALDLTPHQPKAGGLPALPVEEDARPGAQPRLDIFG